MKNEKATEIISAISKELSLHGEFPEGFIYATLEHPIDADVLRKFLRRYNLQSFIKTASNMRASFVLVVF
jgi:hypothetical protein